MLSNIQLHEELYCLLTILDRSVGHELKGAFKKECIRFNMGVLAEGSATDELLDLLGLKSNEKICVFSIIKKSCKRKMLRLLLNDFYFDMPGKGIAFTIPISRIGGLKTHVLSKDEEEGSGEVSSGYDYEVILAVTNRGFAEDVIQAAKEIVQVGATVLNARGMGVDETEKFFGITISPEKELVLILAKIEDTKKIMSSILKKTGPLTEAKSIAFSMPVSDIVGLPENLYYNSPEEE